DIHAKTKVVRAPARKQAAGAGKQLAPLIAGVIERRRQARRQNTVELPGLNGIPDSNQASEGHNTPAPSLLPPSGFDKVRLRGGGVPERRIASGTVTPTRREPSPARVGRSPSALRNSFEDERTPLMGQGQGNDQA
ncbi:hypothetical protein JCM3770_006372, partial [Rhodotorula araucariae]